MKSLYFEIAFINIMRLNQNNWQR